MPCFLLARVAARCCPKGGRGIEAAIVAVCVDCAFAACLTLWLAAAIVTPIVAGSPTIGQNFDGPDSVWQLVDGESRLICQERIRGGARTDAGCERIVLAGPIAQSALLLCPVSHLVVLDEFEALVWVKASRPDLQFAARIVLPRSTDRDGRPVTAVVRGTTYRRPGHWQQLVLKQVPDLLADEVRVLRAAPGAKIDPREAYVDAVALLVPGEPNGVEVFTDQLEVEGVLLPSLREPAGITRVSFPPPAVQPTDVIPSAPATISPNTSETRVAPSIRLHGSVLTIDGKPFMPRVVPWHDEPLELLEKCGFNTVELSTAPSAELSAEAKRHGLWFVCPAPRPGAIGDGPVGRTDDRVLAWLLDDTAIELDPAYGRNWAALVRQHDCVRGRPVVAAPRGRWDPAANAADILVAEHPRVGRLAPPDYGRWLAGRFQLVQPGVPLWASVAAQFGEPVVQHSNELAETLTTPPDVDANQLEAIVELACLRGCRGIRVQTSSPLDEDTPHARHRRAFLALLNRRLQLIEPWVASGKVVSQIESADSRWVGVVLLVDRARLLVPVAADVLSDGNPSQQSPAAVNGETAFVVPGIPEACQVYWLSTTALRPLAMQRVAGGTRIVLPAQHEGMVLLTEDPSVVQTFRRHVATNASETQRLVRSLLEHDIKRVSETARGLRQLGYDTDIQLRAAASTESQLRQYDTLVASGRADAAAELAEVIDRDLQVRADEQRQLIRSPSHIVNNPLSFSFEQLLEYARFSQRQSSLRGGENLLYGGDFEDLGQMMQFGWQHVADESRGTESRVTLTADRPQHGGHCLEMVAAPTPESSRSAPVTTAPVWVNTHPIPVEQGQLIEVTGWIRIDAPIQHSIDGLEVVDSLGGPELALTVRQTEGWQPFHIIRGVPESSELRVTFALTGIGTAQIDGVMVRELEKPALRRLPLVLPNENVSGPNTADSSGPLFQMPSAR